MSESLLIHLQRDGRMAWLTLDAQGRSAAASSDGVPPKQTVSRAQRVVAIVPAEDVLLLDTPRIAAARAQLAKAVPFALEDQVVAPVEELHFAVPEKLAGERVPVAIVARKTLRGWIDQLAAHGITADVMLAETQLLTADESATIVIDGTRALWRNAPAQAGVFESADLPEWLGVIRGAASTRLIDIYDFRGGSFPPVVDAHVRYHPQQHDLLAFLSARAGAEEINLLQGEFAAVHRRAPTLTLWRNAAILSAAALVLMFVYVVADYVKVSRHSEQLEAASRQILHDAFPQMDTVPGDSRQLMQSALDNLRGGADSAGVLHLLMQVGPVLSSTTRTTLTNIEYHNSTLELALRAPDVPTLDLMRERLANLPGLTVQVTAANTGANGVEGRLRIVGGKS